MEPGMKTPSENMCITRCHLQQLEGTILRISQRKWLVSTLEGNTTDDDHCRKAEALPRENTKKRMTKRWRRRSPLSSHSTVSPWPNQPRSHEERDDTIWLKNTSWINTQPFVITSSKFAFQTHTYMTFGFSHLNSNCPLPHLISWLR